MPRPASRARADLDAFCGRSAAWIVEGCYGELVAAILQRSPLLVLLDPGEAACVAHCRARPWEQHKYASRAEQDERLGFLLDWVAAYYTRQDSMSLHGHRALFDDYDGPKCDLRRPERYLDDLQPWLR